MKQSIQWINQKICEVMPGIKTYGIARPALRDGNVLPVVGDIYVGVDDVNKAQLYHKQISIASQLVPRSGYGDVVNVIDNTYTMAMVIYFNEDKCGLTAEELYVNLQVILSDYPDADITITSAILNDAQVWASEYGGRETFRLPINQRLIQIGYTVVATVDKRCIKINKCKN